MNAAEPLPEMTLRDYATVVLRRKWLVVLPIVIAGLTSFALSSQSTKMFSATAEVLVQLPPTASSVGSTGAVMSPRMVENELETARGSEVRAVVREVAGAGPTLSVGSADGNDVFSFTAVSSSPQLAADTANLYADSYIERQRSALVAEFAARGAVIEEQIQAIEDGEADRNRLSEYETQLEDLRVSSQLAETSGARLIDRATTPGTPFEPQPMRSLMLALVVGGLIGLGAAFLVDYLDRTIRDEEELVRASGLPNLAVVPHLEAADKAHGDYVVSREAPGSAGAETYRNLRTAVKFMGLERELRIIQVTSSRPGEGKTTTATNFAYAASKAGQTVLLIDCDLRKPQVHNFFGLSNYKGFTSVLLGEAKMHEVAQELAGSNGLLVVPAGDIPPNPSELLAGDGARKALAQIGRRFDLIVIDSPPVLAVSDPVVLTELVDGVIVVVSGKSTDTQSLNRTLERLRQVDAEVIGTVFNDSQAPEGVSYTYGYTDKHTIAELDERLAAVGVETTSSTPS